MRKSKPMNNKNKRVQPKELFIVEEKKPFKVEDFLPTYSYSYEGIESDEEALQMSNSLSEFIKTNKEIVLDGYSSKDMSAVIEGFQRAVAVAELFFKSLYLDSFIEGEGDLGNEQ